MSFQCEPPPLAPNLVRQGQFTDYTTAQKVAIVAAVVTAVALTALSTVFFNSSGLAVGVLAAMGITALALSFRDAVIANETYYLNNPTLPRFNFWFVPPEFISTWYRANTIRVQPSHHRNQGTYARSNHSSGSSQLRQVPGSSYFEGGTPARETFRPDQGTPARGNAPMARGTPELNARVVGSRHY